MTSLHDIAPRLARARDQYVAEQARQARERAALERARHHRTTIRAARLAKRRAAE